jgi:hypothetical protein
LKEENRQKSGAEICQINCFRERVQNWHGYDLAEIIACRSCRCDAAMSRTQKKQGRVYPRPCFVELLRDVDCYGTDLRVIREMQVVLDSPSRLTHPGPC